ncbi:acetylornithine deacetylase [Ochrobactrum sp. MYb15]|uniref:acetylornithine deacetylase n=1 Tax=Brucella pituitosa TaxID=571256 RepID=UPI000CFD1ABB|nr:acetylornithine deacetylase [Ochrobactrum sp. MYb19]PRA60588.1 acetylornithine deacetylase [Ochrobactrum sp. MYb18]PRA73457.1 acetylornithine deacetylase [Brucella thiophenivorans]PRA85432.1 acetylornithine deacetylase [Ochrobactrum sp. MYb14]PRA94980.1 acetylornithine deacetylase [Ochrobactrum sp. MYb15]
MSDSFPLEILEKLIGFPSISGQNNLTISNYVRSLASSFGARVETFSSADEGRQSLLIAVGPDNPGGIVLSGHMDVVPAAHQAWSGDPFRLRHGENKLFGRGSVDMKGFLALALSAAREASARDLLRPLYLAFSYDEETTCEGVKPIVSYIKDRRLEPACVIVGEPTNLRIVGAHKGAIDWNIQVNGMAAHSSLPHLGANAIHAGARIVNLVDELAKYFKLKGVQGAELFDVPYTTVSVGLIAGGSAANVIPAICNLHVEARPLEFGDGEWILSRIKSFIGAEIIPKMKVTAPDANVVVAEVDAIPPLVRDPSGKAETTLRELTGLNKVEAVSYATEAGFFQAAGLPTVVFGPGSIEQAHQPDEYITEAQFNMGERFLQNLVQSLS